MTELELILYWTLLVLSALLLGLGTLSLVKSKIKLEDSGKKIKAVKQAKTENVPNLFAVLEKLVPDTRAHADDEVMRDGKEMDAEDASDDDEEEDIENPNNSVVVEEKTSASAIALPSPSLPTCEECGSESMELRPLILAVEGLATTTKKVCPNCLKRLTLRHTV